MASPRLWRFWLFQFMVFVFVVTSGSGASAEPATVKVISDLKDSIVQKMGWKPEEVQISNTNSIDTMIGHATLYEFDLQIGNAILPLRLSEDVTSWQFMEDILANEDQQETTGSENTVAERRQKITPVLAPFQLAGPLELWIQDADHMRLSVPHDVEAGILKKVMLADGAVVTVKGARELNLRQPLQLPLPLGSGTEDSNLASSLFALASKLRHASANDGKPLSLRIVGPSSLVASSITEPDSASNRLKVKRLAPGSVELISRQQQETSPMSIEASIDSLGRNDMWMWPLPSLNSSHPKLLGFDQLLREILGSLAQKEESFKLLKARAAAASFAKVQFELERKLGSDMVSSDTWPEWRTKPSIERLQFELIAKLEGDKMLPVSLHQIEPVIPVETSSISSLAGMLSRFKMEKEALANGNAVPTTLAPTPTHLNVYLLESLRLEHQLMRVPFEHLKISIRTSNRTVEKEMNDVMSGVAKATKKDMSKEEVVQHLTYLAAIFVSYGEGFSNGRVASICVPSSRNWFMGPKQLWDQNNRYNLPYCSDELGTDFSSLIMLRRGIFQIHFTHKLSPQNPSWSLYNSINPQALDAIGKPIICLLLYYFGIERGIEKQPR